MTKTAININNVSFAYSGVPVLRDVSLKIYENEFIGIIGPNAGGKSTLLKLILGLLQPDKGTVEVFGHGAAANCGVAYVPQHVGFSRDFPITVNEVILLGFAKPAVRFSAYDKEQIETAGRIMTMLEIKGIANCQIGSLSGGELQRVLIARALVRHPKILVLDEPTTNIDMRTEKNIFAFLKNYSERMTIIVVSHDVAFISHYIDRVVCLNKTLVSHDTESIDGKTIRELYDASVKMVSHH